MIDSAVQDHLHARSWRLAHAVWAIEHSASRTGDVGLLTAGGDRV